MLSYVIVGSGYRSEYFARVAKNYPELFRALYLCRSEEKAALMKTRTGVEATTSPAACEAFRPDFAVIAVDRDHLADVAEEWITRGYPVVTETPVGSTSEKLARLWQLSGAGAKIVCCEQYHRYPILAAGLAALESGKIGTPSSLYISMLHDYHGASLIRRALRIRPGEPFVIHGTSLSSPVAATDSRQGACWDGHETAVERTIAHIAFAGGQEAVYDFSSVQYRSFLRSRHFTVRGNRGEWSDTQLLYLDQANEPRREALLPDLPQAYRCLDSQALRDRRRNWTAELAPDTVQDEFAIASILLDMGGYLAGGLSPYPLAEALEDAYFWLLLQEAARHPWQAVRSQEMPWH